MKIFQFLRFGRTILPIIVGTLALSACRQQQQSVQTGCTIDGQTTFTEYPRAYLLTLDDRCLDSTVIANGHFCFHLTDTIAKPYAVTVKLATGLKAVDWMEMPVMVETGTVTLDLGEYIHTSGTPLNLAVQDFLDGLQACKDGVLSQKSVAPEDIRGIFSAYYRQQIVANKDNPLGDYIFRTYGLAMTDKDREEVTKLLKVE